MPKRDYPVPCIRTIDQPTGAKIVLELPGDQILPFKSEMEAKSFVFENGIHRKYARCFIQTAPKKYEQLAADDGLGEDHDEVG